MGLSLPVFKVWKLVDSLPRACNASGHGYLTLLPVSVYLNYIEP